MKTVRVQMNVSIASAKFSYQPNEVVDLPDDKQTRNWLAIGHAVRVPSGTPLSLRDFDCRDLDAEEVLRHGCAICGRRAALVLGNNKPYCLAHFKAMREAGT